MTPEQRIEEAVAELTAALLAVAEIDTVKALRLASAITDALLCFQGKLIRAKKVQLTAKGKLHGPQ